MKHYAFCLLCGSNCCVHLQRSTKMMLTPRELDVVRATTNPQYTCAQEMADGLKLSLATIKVYLSKIYTKLGWYGGSVRQLALWGIAHREELGIPMPTREQFCAADPLGMKRRAEA